MSDWASDVPVSLPEALDYTYGVPMFGFVFTERGLLHDFTSADYEEFRTPAYGPTDKTSSGAEQVNT